ncbi:MAG: hypothetical protein HY096_14235 [Nitrospinae bacterium]|nr:hypothetical protein [Nitrospinota bacterium]MBI5749828.1 hypothetical protein [Nitrospinota bacterium]
MFKKIGSIFCIFAIVSLIVGTIVEATDSSNNASNNNGGATKAVPKAKLKQFKEKK